MEFRSLLSAKYGFQVLRYLFKPRLLLATLKVSHKIVKLLHRPIFSPIIFVASALWSSSLTVPVVFLIYFYFLEYYLTRPPHIYFRVSPSNDTDYKSCWRTLLSNAPAVSRRYMPPVFAPTYSLQHILNENLESVLLFFAAFKRASRLQDYTLGPSLKAFQNDIDGTEILTFGDINQILEYSNIIGQCHELDMKWTLMGLTPMDLFVQTEKRNIIKLISLSAVSEKSKINTNSKKPKTFQMLIKAAGLLISATQMIVLFCNTILTIISSISFVTHKYSNNSPFIISDPFINLKQKQKRIQSKSRRLWRIETTTTQIQDLSVINDSLKDDLITNLTVAENEEDDDSSVDQPPGESSGESLDEQLDEKIEDNKDDNTTKQQTDDNIPQTLKRRLSTTRKNWLSEDRLRTIGHRAVGAIKEARQNVMNIDIEQQKRTLFSSVSQYRDIPVNQAPRHRVDSGLCEVMNYASESWESAVNHANGVLIIVPRVDQQPEDMPLRQVVEEVVTKYGYSVFVINWRAVTKFSGDESTEDKMDGSNLETSDRKVDLTVTHCVILLKSIIDTIAAQVSPHIPINILGLSFGCVPLFSLMGEMGFHSLLKSEKDLQRKIDENERLKYFAEKGAPLNFDPEILLSSSLNRKINSSPSSSRVLNLQGESSSSSKQISVHVQPPVPPGPTGFGTSERLKFPLTSNQRSLITSSSEVVSTLTQGCLKGMTLSQILNKGGRSGVHRIKSIVAVGGPGDLMACLLADVVQKSSCGMKAKMKMSNESDSSFKQTENLKNENLFLEDDNKKYYLERIAEKFCIGYDVTDELEKLTNQNDSINKKK